MDRIRFSVILVVYIVLVSGQYSQSPCPGIFEYQSDGANVFGLIHLKSNGPVSSVHIRANFTIAARLISNYVGRLEPIGNNMVLQNYNRGEQLTYRVHFPVSSPLPRITAIIANGNVICYGPGDIPGPNQYVTSVSLEHTLFIKSGSPGSGSFNNQYDFRPKPDPVFQVVGDFGPNTQVFTVNDLDNKQGSWESTYYPVEVTNITRPGSRPGFTQPVTPPVRPPPEYTLYYPEETTEAARPQSPQVVSPQPPFQSQPPQAVRPQPPFQSQPSQPPFQSQPSQPPFQSQPSQPPFQSQPSQPPFQSQPSQPPFQSQAPQQSQPPRPQQPLPQPPVSSIPSTPVECGVIAGGNERLPLIFNGQSYTRGDWPWLVAIYRRKEGSLTFICSGTLVSDRHVVTAAHCMHQKNQISTIKDIVVKVGVYNLEDWGDDISLTRTLTSASIHQSYNASTLENDILVVTFDRKVEFNTYIRPACLWNGNTDLLRIVGASGVVAGWGSSEVGPSGQGEPRMVRIPIVSTEQCRASKPEFHRLTSAFTLCAGDRKGSGPCTGDSGGGLYILEDGRWRLRGVVSLSLRPQNGDNTCNLNEYIVFTDTAQYLDWVKNIITRAFFD